MYELYQTQSAVDGHELPSRWKSLSIAQKSVVVNFLNTGRPIQVFPFEWKLITPTDKEDVIRHLAKLGLLNEYISRHNVRDLKLLSDMQRVAERRPQWQTHDAPNGGNRILPSMYASLRDHWLTKQGESIRPQRMNSGHLENSLKLLKESNGNCVAKCTSILGSVRKHFRNSAEVCALIDKLCTEMQQVDVDDQYPVFREMAATLAAREQLAKTREIIEAASDYEDYNDDIPF